MIASPPAGPPGLPLVGHLHRFLPDKLGFLSRCAEAYGDVVELDLGGPTLLLRDPDDIHHVLVANFRGYEKTPRLTSPRGRRLSGKGLLTTYADEHIRQRRLLQPMFHHRVVASFAGAVNTAGDRMLAGWEDGAEIDVAAESMRWSRWILGRILFSVDYFDGARELGDALVTRRRYVHWLFDSLFPRPEWLPLPIVFRFRRAQRTIDRALHAMIEARRGADDPPDDLLTMLVEARYDDGTGMSDAVIHDEAMILSITGYETIGEALAWTWWLLSDHPDAEARMRDEVDAVLGGRSPGWNDLSELPHTTRVLQESMRLYPPTWIFLRVARENDALPSGASVPAGTKLYLCPWVVHRDPRFFPGPDRFDPDRFAEPAASGRPRLAYFPFGAGPRLCIGEPIARMIGVALLARVAQRFRLETVPGQRIEPDPAVTLRPKGGIRMRVRDRGAAAG